MSVQSQRSDTPLDFLLISSFNVDNLKVLLGKDEVGLRIRASSAPFGQVMQTLLTSEESVWGTHVRGAVIWTKPEAISREYGKLLAHEDAVHDVMLGEVDEFCQAIKKIPAQVKYIFVPTWITAAFEGRLGLLDMDLGRGLSLALMRMNLRLVENLRQDSRVVVLDAGRWVSVHGEQSFNARLWYMSKTPYSVDFFKEAAAEIKAALRALSGHGKKLILVDLDDTLWGGIVGDVGWQGLRLGGHDALGEAFRDFQLALKGLKQRGVLLGIISKNEESTALEAICSHPEMVLRLEDLAGWRINWHDKAQNISELVSELNLGLQSVVFLDDNPVERDRVRKALAEVVVPDWPATPLEYKLALQRLRWFDQPQISVEDRERTRTYVTERKRKESLSNLGSVEAWLPTLQTLVLVESVNDANLERVTQLLNKTNQMNLSTRRLTKTELFEWTQEERNMLLAFRVTDKYGDYGLVGIGGLDLSGGVGVSATDFILSCRVMGRKIEETMLHVLSVLAKSRGAAELRLCYRPTAKNQPCLRFLDSAGLKRNEDGKTFILELTQLYPKPAMIALELGSEIREYLADCRERQ